MNCTRTFSFACAPCLPQSSCTVFVVKSRTYIYLPSYSSYQLTHQPKHEDYVGTWTIRGLDSMGGTNFTPDRMESFLTPFSLALHLQNPQTSKVDHSEPQNAAMSRYQFIARCLRCYWWFTTLCATRRRDG